MQHAAFALSRSLVRRHSHSLVAPASHGRTMIQDAEAMVQFRKIETRFHPHPLHRKGPSLASLGSIPPSASAMLFGQISALLVRTLQLPCPASHGCAMIQDVKAILQFRKVETRFHPHPHSLKRSSFSAVPPVFQACMRSKKFSAVS